MTDEKEPFVIGPHDTPNPLLETLLGMLHVSRFYLLNAARDLSASQLDAQPKDAPNTIGMLLAHVAAAEAMFCNITLEGVQFRSDQDHLAQAFRFERNPLEGSDVESYRRLLQEIRRGTEARLRGRDDAWLASPMTFRKKPSNIHYYWTHLLLDEARHTGQVILIRKHLLAQPDVGFDPYAMPTRS